MFEFHMNTYALYNTHMCNIIHATVLIYTDMYILGLPWLVECI